MVLLFSLFLWVYGLFLAIIIETNSYAIDILRGDAKREWKFTELFTRRFFQIAISMLLFPSMSELYYFSFLLSIGIILGNIFYKLLTGKTVYANIEAPEEITYKMKGE